MAKKSAYRAARDVANVYRGYMPIGLPQHRPKNRVKPWWKVEGRPRVTIYPKKEVEAFCEQSEYPSLNDGSRKGIKNQVRLDWYDSIKSLPTFDQKLHEIDRHCDHYIAHMNNWIQAYDSLPMIQYLTNTHLVSSLPDRYKNSETNELPDNDRILNVVEQAILNQIALDKFDVLKRKPRYLSRSISGGDWNQQMSNLSVQNVINSVKKLVAAQLNQQLMEYHYDLGPSVRSWWYHSGFEPPNRRVFYKSRKDENGFINQMIQVNGSSAMNVRSDSALPPIVLEEDSIVSNETLLEKQAYPLKHYGAHFKFKKPVALPGFWCDEKTNFDFPHTCFLTMDCLKLREAKRHLVVKKLDDEDNSLEGQAILTAFSWLNSLSMYHGYTPFQELDYPFTTQVVTTDGQNWMFNVFQLNCHAFHRDLGGPKKNNICWSTGRMKLFDSYKDGQFEGVNKDVIKMIIKFLSQKTSPEYTSTLSLRPNLSVDERPAEEKEKTRIELRSFFENRGNKWINHQWSVPLYEHIFYRSPQGRNRITHAKARWHIPRPKYPKMFE